MQEIDKLTQGIDKAILELDISINKLTTRNTKRRNKKLAASLKAYYNNRCQICGIDFAEKYGVTIAEAHHIIYLAQNGRDIKKNVLVVCPNHHRLIHAAKARFNFETLTFEFPNGLQEKLFLPDHLIGVNKFTITMFGKKVDVKYFETPSRFPAPCPMPYYCIGCQKNTEKTI